MHPGHNGQSARLTGQIRLLERTVNPVKRQNLLLSICSTLEKEQSDVLPEYLEALYQSSRELNRADDMLETAERLMRILVASDRAEEARRFGRGALEEVGKRGSTPSLVRALTGLAFVERRRGSYGAAGAALDYAFALLRTDSADDLRLALHKERGDLLGRLGDHAGALEQYLAIVSLLCDGGPSRECGMAYSDAGLAHAAMGEFDRAIPLLLSAVEQFAATDVLALEVRAVANLASLYEACGRLKEAHESGRRALLIYERLSDKEGIAGTLLNLSNVQEKEGQPEAAVEYRLRALDLFEHLENSVGIATTLLQLGHTYGRSGRLPDALYVLECGLDTLEGVDEPKLKAALLRSLAEVCEEIGNLRKALDYLKQWSSLDSHIGRESTTSAAALVQARFDLERSRRDAEVLRLKAEQSENEARRTNAELHTVSLQLLEKNTFIERLLERISELEKRGNAEMKKSLGDLKSEVRRSAENSTVWATVSEHFERLNHDLMKKLAARFPTLTQIELRNCALAAAGLSTGEIASLLNQATRSVEGTRFRARKKIGIDRNVDFAVYLQKIVEE